MLCSFCTLGVGVCVFVSLYVLTETKRVVSFRNGQRPVSTPTQANEGTTTRGGCRKRHKMFQ